MAKKKITDGLEKSKDTKLKQAKKKPTAKKVKVDHLHPKAKNKDSVTDNIKSKSKASKVGGLGKIQRVPLSQSRNDKPKKK